ncbi:hypothetical protein GGF32_002365 [Allomyces javanicus]|nr:hypothetical protein GGF32_002365 [Allomyces javanicus]
MTILPRPASVMRALEAPVMKLGAVLEPVAMVFAQVLMRLMGPILIVAAIALIGACAMIHLGMVLPDYRPDPETGRWWAHAVWCATVAGSALLVVDLYFNYAMAVTTRSYAHDVARVSVEAALCDARVPKMQLAKAGAMPSLQYLRSLRLENGPPLPMYVAIFLPSARLNNCVGHYNHRYFVVFLVYLSVGCLLFSVLAAPYVPTALDMTAEWPATYYDRQLFIFCYMIAVILGLVLTGMAAWHVYLLLTAQTQLEWMDRRELPDDESDPESDEEDLRYNPYNLGWQGNLRVFLNSPAYPWYYVLFPIPVPPLGNGFVYPTKRTYTGPGWTPRGPADALVPNGGANVPLTDIRVDA